MTQAKPQALFLIPRTEDNLQDIIFSRMFLLNLIKNRPTRTFQNANKKMHK